MKAVRSLRKSNQWDMTMPRLGLWVPARWGLLYVSSNSRSAGAEPFFVFNPSCHIPALRLVMVMKKEIN